VHETHGWSRRLDWFVVLLTVLMLSPGYATAAEPKKFTLINVDLNGTKIWLPSSIMVYLRIPVIPATQSGAKLPPHPKEACHPIRTKAAPHRSPIGAQRRLG